MMDRGSRQQSPVNTGDVERVFEGANPFAVCPSVDQAALRSVFTSNPLDLAIRTGPDEPLRAGCLYVVLHGRVGVAVRGGPQSDRQVVFHLFGEGAVFGEVWCPIAGLPVADFGVRWVSASRRRFRRSNHVARQSGDRVASVRVLEIAPHVVEQLLQVKSFERALSATLIGRQRFREVLSSFRFLNEPGLAIAYLCIVPTFGTDICQDRGVMHMGGPTATSKAITIQDLSNAVGLSLNATRYWLQRLEQAKYLKAARSRRAGTVLTITRREELVAALVDHSLDF